MCSTKVSIRMGIWLLLTFFVCLHNQLSPIDSIPFQITPGQKTTKVMPRDHEASLISLTTEAEGAWKLAKKL